MEKISHRYNFDGLEIEVPLKKRDGENGYIEDYSNIIDYPQFSPLGHPVILSFYEPCRFFKGQFEDCSDCPHFKRAEANHFTLLGICTNEKCVSTVLKNYSRKENYYENSQDENN